MYIYYILNRYLNRDSNLICILGLDLAIGRIHLFLGLYVVSHNVHIMDLNDSSPKSRVMAINKITIYYLIYGYGHLKYFERLHLCALSVYMYILEAL